MKLLIIFNVVSLQYNIIILDILLFIKFKNKSSSKILEISELSSEKIFSAKSSSLFSKFGKIT